MPSKMLIPGCRQQVGEQQMNSSSTNVVSTALVQCMENADAINITSQIDACRSLFPEENIFTCTIAGATVAVTIAELGLKLNNVVRLGTAAPANDDDLRAIERIYSSIGLPTLIDLCPYADTTTLNVLSCRGYRVVAFLNAYIRSLEDINANDTIQQVLSRTHEEPGISIKHADKHEHETFVRCSVEGFRENGRPEEVLSTLARIATRRPDTLCYLVKVQDEVASTGAMAVIETSYGRVGYFYLSSTVKKYRHRGLHQVLEKARLLDARKRGCFLAIVEARVGSSSGRNAERDGFQVAYTKTFFKKEILPHDA